MMPTKSNPLPPRLRVLSSLILGSHPLTFHQLFELHKTSLTRRRLRDTLDTLARQAYVQRLPPASIPEDHGRLTAFPTDLTATHDAARYAVLNAGHLYLGNHVRRYASLRLPTTTS